MTVVPTHQSTQGIAGIEAGIDNVVLPFQIEGQTISGRIVRLNHLANDVLSRHAYPERVARLLGEALVLVAMLGSTLKFEGRFIVQVQSQQKSQKEHQKEEVPIRAPIRTLHAEYNTTGAMRGYAQFDEAALDALSINADKNDTALFGTQAYMALTIDPKTSNADTAMERYQGIVPLEGGSLAQAALGYFERSVQIETALHLVAAPDARLQWQAGGILLQKIAAEGGAPAISPDPDAWNRATTLMQTVRDGELLDATLPLSDLLWRLFHEDGVRVFPPRGLAFACPCSRARVYNMLTNLPQEAQEDMKTDPIIEVRCEFCNELYHFEPQDLMAKP